jgi:hypothetical protein
MRLNIIKKIYWKRQRNILKNIKYKDCLKIRIVWKRKNKSKYYTDARLKQAFEFNIKI